MTRLTPSSPCAIACLLLAVGLLTTGCAGSLRQPRPKANENAKFYQSPRFLLPSPIGPVSVTVTAGDAPDLPQSSDKEWLTLLLAGAALAPLGLVAPPLYAGALVVGGGMVATGSVAGYGSERLTFNAVARAVMQSDLPAALTETLRARALPPDGDPDIAALATIAVPGWGVVGGSGKPTGMHCLVAGVELSISREGKEVLNDQIKLTLVDSSTDAPPVQCASLSKFAERDGRLVRETIRDYAEVLALMIIDHLNKLQ